MYKVELLEAYGPSAGHCGCKRVVVRSRSLERATQQAEKKLADLPAQGGVLVMTMRRHYHNGQLLVEEFA